jgi:hypothetical protein
MLHTQQRFFSSVSSGFNRHVKYMRPANKDTMCPSGHQTKWPCVRYPAHPALIVGLYNCTNHLWVQMGASRGKARLRCAKEAQRNSAQKQASTGE